MIIKQDLHPVNQFLNPLKTATNVIKSCCFIQHINETIDIINVFIMSINETTEAPNADYHLF